jgi:DNA-binding response OmpR family regulator
MVNDEVRVLIVDDNDDAAEALAALLQISGYVTQTASGAVAALELADGFRPHCVILDVKMPGIDGLGLARSLRAKYADDVVLIAVTGGSADEPVVSDTFRIVDHYLKKPVTGTDLAKVLPPTGD